MRKIFFDIETKNIFQEVGTNNPADLDISVVGLYDSKDDKYHTFFEEDFGNLWPIIETADLLVTFNGDHFDIPLLNKHYHGDLLQIKSLDLLKEIHKSAGRRMKLGQLAEGTLQTAKSGYGLDAIRWWREGNLEKLKQYCINDVRITRELYEYALKNNKLFFKEGGRLNEVKLDTKHWEVLPEPAALNYTLPF